MLRSCDTGPKSRASNPAKATTVPSEASPPITR